MVVLIMALIYFYLMYSFSMLSAMGTVVFSGVSRRGASAMLTVAIFAYFSNLCGCTTNCSTGPVIIYFGREFGLSGLYWDWLLDF